MRILLIEDDRALCTALLPALQAAGYTVDTCHDGADGKALLCGGAYDVCVLDRMLPGLDGLSLPRQGMYHPGVNADGPVRHQ